MTPVDVWDGVMSRSAHRHDPSHADEVKGSARCGCFFCLDVFAPDEITDWLPEGTALCPRCGIDSVIGDRSEFPVTDALFLKAMQDEWFCKDVN